MEQRKNGLKKRKDFEDEWKLRKNKIKNKRN